MLAEGDSVLIVACDGILGIVETLVSREDVKS